jgi:3',5'-cyclic AMP phosphodiesterase CpdA
MRPHVTPASGEGMTRRDAIKAAGIAAAAVGLAGLTPSLLARAARPALADRKRALRIAHLTDIHVQPELHAGEGMLACLRHVNALADKPDLIITGGDQVMDSFEHDHDRVKMLWELWQSCLKSDNSIALEHTLGNHDIWGWNKKKAKADGTEKGYGKAWACEMFARDKTYKSLDKNGWHIVILDSIQHDPQNEDGYIAQIDEEQFAWLEADLNAAPAAGPVVVFSHVPIFGVCVYNDAAKKKDDQINWQVSGGTMHSDAHRLRKLFLKHPNVKLCMSGHIHQRDRCEFNDVTYICDGAVSGAWWKGRNEECDEGYGLINLYDDGTFDHAYQTYGWVAKK